MATGVAFDRLRYFGEALSENIAVTPEGYRICRNTIIGRSGFQTYRVSELTDPDKLLGDRSPHEEVEVYRDPKEVFSASTLASFEGKTFTLSHPDELLDPSNEKEHHVGHVQNVRKGKEQLESGDWPMLADILVTDAEAIRAIDRGERQLSCGYIYQLAREGYRFEQRNILGNHVALVPKGRAGEEARINDSALEPVKERKPVKNLVDMIFGRGLKDYAKDADPEELANAVKEVSARNTATDKAIEKKEPTFVCVGKDLKGRKIFALDSEAEEMDAEEKKEEKSEDKKEEKVIESKDAEVKTTVEPPKTQNTGDADENEMKKRLHDALDMVISKSKAASEDKQKSEDASVAELQSLMNGFLGEKEKEGDAEPCPKCGELDCAGSCGSMDAEEEKEEKSEDAEEEKSEDAEEEEKSEDSTEEKEEESEDKEMEGEDAQIVREEPVLEKKEVPQSQLKDSGARFAFDILKSLKPAVAKANDAKLNAAFDVAFKRLKSHVGDSSKKSGGSYTKFRAAASKVKDSVMEEKETYPQAEARRYEEITKKIREDSRKRNLSGRR